MKKFFAVIFLFIALVTTSLTSQRGVSFENIEHKVSPWLLKQFEKTETKSLLDAQASLPILVVMKDQADLTGANELQTKEEKGKFVYGKLTQTALQSQKDVSDFLSSKKVNFKNYYILNFIAVDKATKDLVAELIKRSDVARVIGNPTIKNDFEKLKSKNKQTVVVGRSLKKAELPVGDNIAAVGADKVWTKYNVNGAGIVIAGQDTGYEYTHPALVKQYRGTKDDGSFSHDYNWHDAIHSNSGQNKCGVDSVAPCDDDQHGTHTMGTMLGDDGDANKIGMAPGAKWIGCRNMDAGNGTPQTYLECFEWLLAPYKRGDNAMTSGRPELAPHVINNSWGCPASEGCEGTEMKPALDAMAAAGIMVVVSAGNSGPNCMTANDQPASHGDLVLTVGAINHRDWKIANFSSRGPSKLNGNLIPEVTAPGVSIRSSIPGGQYQGGFWSGTSMAGPHVAGLVALIWSAQPNLIGKISETREIIRTTSVGIKATQTCGNFAAGNIPNAVYGYGRIDAVAAVSKALQANLLE